MSSATGQGITSPAPTLQKRRTRVLLEKAISDDEFMAAAIGDVEWLRQSLRTSKGAIKFDKNGLAPLHLSAIHGRLDCIKLLIDKFKVDVNLSSSTGWCPLHLAISNQTGKRSYQCLVYLLEKGADPSICNDDGITPMHQAASEGHVQCLKALIEAGGLVDGEDNRGHKPIDLAKLWGHRKCARILAAESWHRDKNLVAKDLHQLKKLKMQEVLQEIELDEQEKAEHQFYGEIAYNEWLDKHKLPKMQTGPSKVEESDNQSKLRNHDNRGRESLHKANSVSVRKPVGQGRQEPHQSKISNRRKVEPNKADFSQNKQTDEFDQAEDNVDNGEGNDQSNKELRYSNLFPWNKSVKPANPTYVANLPDHYPRDEYTMQPKHPARRPRTASPLMILTDDMHHQSYRLLRTLDPIARGDHQRLPGD